MHYHRMNDEMGLFSFTFFSEIVHGYITLDYTVVLS